MRNILECLLAALTLSCVVSGSESDERPSLALQSPYCTGFDCVSRDELIATVSGLRSEIQQYQDSLADSQCTACYSNPCQNNGTCVPILFTYMCKCPDNTYGRNCERVITCTDRSCGTNAVCSVRNHQINCICKPGTSGNPWIACSTRTRQTCFHGDPHYNTFDSLRFDYQGTCPYIFAQSTPDLEQTLSKFLVKAKNELLTPGTTFSDVRSTQVEMYNQTIFIDEYSKVYYHHLENVHRMCNNCRSFRSYLPSSMWKISITYHGGYVRVQNDEFVSVSFRRNRLCLTVPDTKEIRNSGAVVGLSGDLDGECKDDLRMRNGTILPVDHCWHASQTNVDIWADDWITSEYTNFGPNVACANGKVLTNVTGKCMVSTPTADWRLACSKDVNNAVAACQWISFAADGNGPLGGCQPLGNETISKLYDDCLFDVCRFPDVKCSVISNFVYQCQREVLDVDLHGWRDATSCPLACPAHSSYSECASSCPATCYIPTAPDNCTEPCTDGCTCDYGYVLDTTQPLSAVCIPVEECGCSDDNGNFHPPNSPWLTRTCTQKNVCSNGTLIKQYNECSEFAHCGIQDNQEACICNQGYEGDGYNCTDINECLDPNTCSQDKGQGQCFKIPGSYYCVCSQYYDGDNCQYYRPNRHCADLYVYRAITADGVYEIQPPFINGSVNVSCDMTTDGGGWTLIANALRNETVNRTYDEYVAGFGDVQERDVWMGLSFIQGLAQFQTNSLRLNLFRCASNSLPAQSTDCTYEHFSLLGADTNYAVNITKACTGTELSYHDGWARWDLSKPGPSFVAFDTDTTVAQCSQTFQNTGWWFDTTIRCGPANLNGVRYSCENLPPANTLDTFLFWNGAAINKAEMLLRPFGYPNYDKRD